MAGVHRLYHVQGLTAADFAEDDAIRPHAQCVTHQIALGHRPDAFDIGRPGFQAQNVFLLKFQLRRIFDGDDTLGYRDVIRQTIEQRGFAGTGAAGDQDIQARLNARFQNLCDARRHRV